MTHSRTHRDDRRAQRARVARTCAARAHFLHDALDVADARELVLQLESKPNALRERCDVFVAIADLGDIDRRRAQPARKQARSPSRSSSAPSTESKDAFALSPDAATMSR